MDPNDLHDRVDALGPAARHLGQLRPAHLGVDLDPVLQELVQQAANELDAPIALVSIVLDRVQYFRAHVGLSEPLTHARGTDRDESFCQFVVRDEQVFVVEDAAEDTRVPQSLVSSAGVRAYLGAPIRSGESVIGSFCVLDVAPRTFTPEQSARLQDLADRARARFEVLEAERVRQQLGLLQRSVEPSLPEIRDLLVPIASNVRSARIAATSLVPAVANAHVPDGAQARQALTDLREILDDMDVATGRLVGAIEALESVLLPSAQTCTLAQALEQASELARHALRLAPSVVQESVDGTAALAVEKGTAVGLLAALLTALADIARRQPGSTVRLESTLAPAGAVGLQARLTADQAPDAEALRLALCGLAAYGEADPRVQVQTPDDGVRVHLLVR